MNIFRTFALGITMVGLMMPHATQAEENTATARFFYSETCPTCHVMRTYMDQEMCIRDSSTPSLRPISRPVANASSFFTAMISS